MPSAPEVMGNPWEQRARLGWWRAVYENSKLFLSHPVRGFALTQPRGGLRGPFLFALVVLLVTGFVSELSESVYDIVFGPQSPGGLEDVIHLEVNDQPVFDVWWLPASVLGLAGFAGCVIAVVVGIPVFMLILPVVLLVWGGTLHLSLWLVRGLRSSAAGFQGTWATVCYATPAFVFGLVPVIGGVFVILGLGILQGIGFRQLHGTTSLRATVALVLPVLAVLILLAVYVLLSPEPG